MAFRRLFNARTFTAIVRNPVIKPRAYTAILATPMRLSHSHTETDAEFDKRYLDFFNKKDIDGWEIRKGINDIYGHDLVPEPEIVVAILNACRRVNDFALAVRYLESLHEKCGANLSVLWPYMMGEIKPTMDKLGIPTLEELGYNKPELATKNVYDGVGGY